MASFLRLTLCLLLGSTGLFLLWLLSMYSGCRLRGRPLLTRYRYAHRGLHDLRASIPENSLPAFRRAADLGYGAELDVRLTADGRLAVIHDSSLLRSCGIDRFVEDMTAGELSRCRLFGTEETIPYLEDVLPLFAGGPPLLIELKTRHNASGLVQTLCAALDGHPGDFCVQSFDPRALYVLRRRRPDVIRGQLSERFRDNSSVHPVGKFLLANLCLNFLSKPDFIAYRFTDRRALSLHLCRKIYGTREFSWTITCRKHLTAAEADRATVIFEGFLPQSAQSSTPCSAARKRTL